MDVSEELTAFILRVEKREQKSSQQEAGGKEKLHKIPDCTASNKETIQLRVSNQISSDPV
jgi:hypothetical protein